MLNISLETRKCCIISTSKNYRENNRKKKIHACVLGIGVRLYMRVQKLTVEHQLALLDRSMYKQIISSSENYRSLWSGVPSKGAIKLIASPGIFHTLLCVFRKCHDKVSNLKREYAQVAGGRAMKSILRRQFMNRWLDQGLHPTQSNIHLLGDLLHMNLARIGLIISSKKQFSQVKTQAFTSLRSTFSELIVMSRAVSSYVYKVTFLLKDE